MDILEFINKIKGYRDEERQASEEYNDLSNYAKGIGLSDEIVNKIIDIAMDEDEHYNYFSMLYDKLSAMTIHLKEGESYKQYRQRMEYLLGHVHPSQYTDKRPFPQTDSDWIMLAQDIKEKLPQTDWPNVNTDLNIILGNYPGDVDEAKRWLVNKAGELGIT